jgi:hypothetical protein
MVMDEKNVAEKNVDEEHDEALEIAERIDYEHLRPGNPFGVRVRVERGAAAIRAYRDRAVDAAKAEERRAWVEAFDPSNTETDLGKHFMEHGASAMAEHVTEVTKLRIEQAVAELKSRAVVELKDKNANEDIEFWKRHSIKLDERISCLTKRLTEERNLLARAHRVIRAESPKMKRFLNLMEQHLDRLPEGEQRRIIDSGLSAHPRSSQQSCQELEAKVKELEAKLAATEDWEARYRAAISCMKRVLENQFAGNLRPGSPAHLYADAIVAGIARLRLELIRKQCVIDKFREATRGL